ncbi:Stk1 family PASTA domain-containing Ser/Thr kinase [Mycolicibacterium madagascariense]|nr:Stk1 family PASTA domain-containing Ser/Thr kinase [Mycolicibacterium madagascariense]
MTPQQRLSGRYELGELLGIGGMSEVHLARDVRLQRDVAVKLLRADLATDPSVNARFRREAQHAAALNHPAIAAIYDTGEVDGPTGSQPYIVMEYVDGLTLRDLLSTRGPLTVRRAVDVVAEVCAALNFSHQRGIVHRDVKPANVMVGPGGAVKVVDFGIAKAIADSAHSVTQTGAVIGTAHYLSPEQARGDRVDARADVYALGCVFYELLTGTTPFVGDTAVAVAYQHVGREPVPPSMRDGAIPASLDAVVLTAMAKNPDNRYQTAGDMRADLVRWQRGLTPHAADGGGRTASDRFDAADDDPPTDDVSTSQAGDDAEATPSIRRWLAVIGVLVVLTVAGTLAVDVMHRDDRGASAPDASTRPEPIVSPSPSTNPTGIAVPDVSSLTYDDAVRRLTAAGFQRFQKVSLPSPPEMKDRVLGTNPLTNQRISVTDEVTVVLGSGLLPGDAHR